MQFHFYANDTQLYISFSTNNDMESTNSITKIEDCLSDIDKWMSINRLKLNKDKTERLYLFWNYNPQQSLPPLRFGTDIIKPSPHARNIGAIFDTTMSMLPHVNNVCKSAFYHLRTISRIRKYLSTQITEILIHAFVTSKLDHCDSVLYNVPKNVTKKLQSVQNAAARLITQSRKCDHITPILLDLHWLPISERIKFTILLPTFKVLHQQLQLKFKTLSPATYHLDRFGHPLRSVWILLALTLRPMDLEHSLSQPPNFGTTTWRHTLMRHARI